MSRLPKIPGGALALALLTVVLPACDRDGPLAPRQVEPPATEPPTTPGQIVGLVEVTMTGIGNGEASASVISAPDMAALARLRAARAASSAADQGTAGGVASAAVAADVGASSSPAPAGDIGSALHSLGLPANLDATGDGTIQLRPVSTGSFTAGARGNGGERYLQAVFQVRNATTGGTAYDSPRQNLTFLAVATDATLDETAISNFALFNGDPANPALARQILPTGDVTRNTTTGEPDATGGDVFQAFTESALAALVPDAPAGVSTILPYGFVVRAPASPDLRTLPASPAPGEYDGLVTFAFRVPLQASASDDPYTISAIFLAVDDTETRTTESLEEQGTTHLANRAQALGPATMVTLLGRSNPAVPAFGIDRVCRLRTAGTDPNAPAATLIDERSGCTPGAVSLPNQVIVVDRSVANTTGDGRSWPTAFKYLQDALACVRDDAGPGESCVSVKEIWVAEGNHYPDEGAGLTDDYRGPGHANPVSFELVPGIALYGGFAGYETSRQQRDWQARPTILDGDIDQDGTAAGNAYQVVRLHAIGGVKFTRATVLDGFTVTGAEGAGGIACIAEGAGNECSPQLRNLVVSGNRSTPIPFVEEMSGGGISIEARSDGRAAPLLEDIIFSQNNAALGGGLGVLGYSNVEVDLVRATFDSNSSGNVGGAVDIRGRLDSRPTLRMHNTVFRSNTGSLGGAIFVQYARLEAANLEIWNNRGALGGAIYVSTSADLIVSGATIVGNSDMALSPTDHGSINFSDDRASGMITNSIIWDNTSPAFRLRPGLRDKVVLESSIIQGGCPSSGGNPAATCMDILSVDPRLRDPSGGDLRLGSTSPAIDAGGNNLMHMDIFDLNRNGNTSEPIPFDVAGRRRIVDWGGTGTARVDLGAHEAQR